MKNLIVDSLKYAWDFSFHSIFTSLVLCVVCMYENIVLYSQIWSAEEYK